MYFKQKIIIDKEHPGDLLEEFHVSANEYLNGCMKIFKGLHENICKVSRTY